MGYWWRIRINRKGKTSEQCPVILVRWRESLTVKKFNYWQFYRPLKKSTTNKPTDWNVTFSLSIHGLEVICGCRSFTTPISCPLGCLGSRFTRRDHNYTDHCPFRFQAKRLPQDCYYTFLFVSMTYIPGQCSINQTLRWFRATCHVWGKRKRIGWN